MADRRPAAAPPAEFGWQTHRDAQARRLARLPLSEKLAWLEEAQRLVDHIRSQRTTGDPDEPSRCAGKPESSG